MKIKTNTIAMVCLGNAGAALAHALAENFPRSGYDVDPERRITVADLETA
jgi:UDP-N-acetyl-D-mannosaminuronate dehydrogenase